MQDDPMELSVLTHNIFFGFRHDPDSLELKRLTCAKRIYKRYDPDILVLTEAGYGAPNEEGFVFDYQKHFGYEHAVYCPHKGRLGVMVLSKHPLVESLPFTGPLGAGVHTMIDKEPYPEIVAVHPWFDLTGQEKVGFVEQILPRVATPAILCGDLNALSHHDDYDRETLLRSFERFAGPDYEMLVDALLDRKLLEFLEGIGFRDILLEHDPSPTIPTDWADEEKMSPLRMDYILATDGVEVVEAEVITGEDAEQASDHYPVYAKLRV